ncbi:MAG: MFS transporter [Candidatus Brocadia sp.]
MERTITLTEVLENKNFMKLWIGQIVSALGDRLHQMALLGLIMKKGGNVGEELSKITFWSVLPFFLFSLFSGVLSDRWSRKGILIGSDIARLLLVCAIPWVVRDSNSITPAYPVIFAIGIFTCLFSPAKFSIIPNLVEDHHLLVANSLIASSALLSVLAGTAAGCIIFDSMGFRASMYFNGITYLFSAATIWKLTTKEKGRSKIKGVTAVLTDINEGMKYIFHDVRLIILIFFGTIFWFVGISFYVAISDFAGRVWRFTSLTPLGLIFTLLGGGLLIGSVMAGKYGNRVKRNILYTGSIWMLAFGIMAFSLVQSYTVASCIIFFIGIAGGAFLAPINTDIQRITPDGLRGRTFACKDIFVSAAMVAPILIVGKLTTVISSQKLMLYLGTGIFLVGIFVAYRSIKLNTIQQQATKNA